eukprot:1742389-Pyramimonas_sp.AAC.2
MSDQIWIDLSWQLRARPTDAAAPDRRTTQIGRTRSPNAISACLTLVTPDDLRLSLQLRARPNPWRLSHCVSAILDVRVVGPEHGCAEAARRRRRRRAVQRPRASTPARERDGGCAPGERLAKRRAPSCSSTPCAWHSFPPHSLPWPIAANFRADSSALTLRPGPPLPPAASASDMGALSGRILPSDEPEVRWMGAGARS